MYRLKSSGNLHPRSDNVLHLQCHENSLSYAYQAQEDHLCIHPRRKIPFYFDRQIPLGLDTHLPTHNRLPPPHPSWLSLAVLSDGAVLRKEDSGMCIHHILQNADRMTEFLSALSQAPQEFFPLPFPCGFYLQKTELSVPQVRFSQLRSYLLL